MPKFDVLPALDSDLRDWAMKVADFMASPPRSAEDPDTMVFKPLSSNAFAMTFRHSTLGVGATRSRDEDAAPSDLDEPRGESSNSRVSPASLKRVRRTTAIPITGDDRNEKQEGRSSHRKRTRAYHGEIETLREQRVRKELEGRSGYV